ncbi:histone-lysine N-methyltransferase SETMAR [Plakobranchus ocellatus]|uniref:Histone-lysine N-methyltransferase SETMAR n=1 Tax=Plakobranchus ocellatus TaxID=259542 RepID=A0AAV3ZK66_9GAST|nr:histone-lysine N-methyltransferase SETMAR [Plakobranchus ocellatus]
MTIRGHGPQFIDPTKVMATVFWDSRGIILLDILPKGECVNADRYCETLDRLRHAVRRKRPGLLRIGVVLQHDNATPNMAKRTKEWLERYRWDIIPHPAYSADLAPSDFHLFGSLKHHLGGKKFEDEDKFVIGFQSLSQTFSHRLYTHFSHGGKNT